MEYWKLALEVKDNAIITMTELFSHVVGYVMVALIFILSTFGDKVILFNYILVCMIIDLFWGMLSNAVKGTFGLSKCFVRTAIKMATYLSLFAVCVLIEQVMYKEISLLTRTISTVLCSAELLSIMAHILIIRPDTPILKLLTKYFKMEIAKKLSIHKNDVEEAFNNKETEQ